MQPEAIVDIGTATAAGDATKQAINKTPVGGFVYFSDNLQSEQQVQDMLRNVQKYSEDRIGLPALSQCGRRRRHGGARGIDRTI